MHPRSHELETACQRRGKWLRTEAQVVSLHPFPSSGGTWLIACRECALLSLFRVLASYVYIALVPQHSIRHLYVYHSFMSNTEKAMPSCAPQTSVSLRPQRCVPRPGLALTPVGQVRFLLSRPTHQPAGAPGARARQLRAEQTRGAPTAPSRFHRAREAWATELSFCFNLHFHFFKDIFFRAVLVPSKIYRKVHRLPMYPLH